MSDLPIDLRHGELVDIRGAPLRHGDLTFVPAMIELDHGPPGTFFSRRLRFSRVVRERGARGPAHRARQRERRLDRRSHPFRVSSRARARSAAVGEVVHGSGLRGDSA